MHIHFNKLITEAYDLYTTRHRHPCKKQVLYLRLCLLNSTRCEKGFFLILKKKQENTFTETLTRTANNLQPVPIKYRKQLNK